MYYTPPTICYIAGVTNKQKAGMVNIWTRKRENMSVDDNESDYGTDKNINVLNYKLLHTKKIDIRKQIEQDSRKLSYGKYELFKCWYCGYTTNERDDLKRHIILIHKDKKLFSCSLCQYKTNRKNALTNHMLVHTGKKPFKCEKCDFAASQKGNLKRHIILKHSDVKSFKCQHCNYAASIKQHLLQHMVTHTR